MIDIMGIALLVIAGIAAVIVAMTCWVVWRAGRELHSPPEWDKLH
jgi:hypothetical protein